MKISRHQKEVYLELRAIFENKYLLFIGAFVFFMAVRVVMT